MQHNANILKKSFAKDTKNIDNAILWNYYISVLKDTLK